MSANPRQPENEEVTSLNADNLDAEKLDELNQESLEDVAGGWCVGNSCTNYADN
jgi:hypothetical protein